MNFLLDVNAGGIANWLISKGHSVTLVSDCNPRMTDSDILQWAVRESRVIITTDQDFEEMIWREGQVHCGILRLENLPRVARHQLLEYTLKHHSSELASRAVVIAMSRKIRIRRPTNRAE